MIKFQKISDLHLHSNNGIINVDLTGDKDTYLIVAGDVCEYTRSFAWLDTFRSASDMYKKIIFVPGNHEFWDTNVDSYHAKLKSAVLSRGLNMHILSHDNPLYDGDCVFVGDTLWTNLNKGNSQVKMMWNTDALKDRRAIRIGRAYRKLDANDVINLHNTQLDGMAKVIDTNHDKRIVVVTHHAPTLLSCVTAYTECARTMDYLFASDLSEFILDRPNIVFWVHGHTHNRVVYEIGDTTIICSPVGYGDEPGLGRLTELTTYEVK